MRELGTAVFLLALQAETIAEAERAGIAPGDVWCTEDDEKRGCVRTRFDCDCPLTFVYNQRRAPDRKRLEPEDAIVAGAAMGMDDLTVEDIVYAADDVRAGIDGSVFSQRMLAWRQALLRACAIA